MSPGALVSHLGSQDMADMTGAAKRSVSYTSPGIHVNPAQAMAEVAARLGAEMLTVGLDFDDCAMRMGYGDISAVKRLRDAGISVRSTPGLCTALLRGKEKVSMHKCEICRRREFRQEEVDDVFRVGNRHVLVEHIPATVCVQCGERSFDAATAEGIRKKLNEGEQRSDRKVELEVFAY